MVSFTHTRGELANRVPRWADLSAEERAEIGEHVKAFAALLKDEKKTQMVFFDAPERARTVHLDKDGTVEVRNGPLFDDPEFVAGYFLFEAASMDEAVDLAKRGRWLVGSNEVREIKDVQV
jgi:hypothetical protein